MRPDSASPADRSLTDDTSVVAPGGPWPTGEAAQLRAAVAERDAAITALEERLCAARQLEGVGLLAAGVAHDFRNLLTGILANAGLAIEQIPPDHAARELLDRIREAGGRAAELAGQMLDHARRTRPRRRAVDLSALAEEMARLLGSVVAPDAVVALRLDPTLPPIAGDPTALRQVAMNLITNASDALEGAPGTITVATERRIVGDGGCLVTVDGRAVPPGRWLALTVRDTGCGMDEPTRRRVFEPFFTTKPSGRGIGMASVRGIVRAHGGVLCLDTAPGRGTTFSVLFPEPAEALEEPTDAAEEPAIAPAGGTVLVMDDELAVRLVAKRALERHGYDVVVACDGEEGLARFRERADEIVAVFLDLSMPRRDGPAVFRELRRLWPDAPVVLTSGYEEDEARERFADSGETDAVAAAGFVRKPFEPPVLVRAIRRATRVRPAR